MKTRPPTRKSVVAFTLLEVAVASAIFFVAIFAILGLMSQNLRAARSLQMARPDVGSLASEFFATNFVEEGSETGGFGDLHPDATWTRQVYEVGSNGLYQVDFYVNRSVRGRPSQRVTSLLLYRRDGGASGGFNPSRRIR